MSPSGNITNVEISPKQLNYLPVFFYEIEFVFYISFRLFGIGFLLEFNLYCNKNEKYKFIFRKRHAPDNYN